MSKPPVDTSFAINTVAIDVRDKNGLTIRVLNKLEPTTQYKNEGLRPGAPVFGGSLNYQLNALHLMSEWHKEQEVGTILEFADGTMTLVQLQEDRGGTWSDLGTISRGYTGGAITIRAFQKIV